MVHVPYRTDNELPPTPIYGFEKIQAGNMSWKSSTLLADVINDNLDRIEDAIENSGGGHTEVKFEDITGDPLDNDDLKREFLKKVDIVTGKGLSTNDLTNDLKLKLDGIEQGAQKNVQADWNAVEGQGSILHKPTIPTAISQLTNDTQFQTQDQTDTAISVHDLATDAHQHLFDKKLNYNIGVTQEGKLLNVDTQGNVSTKSIDTLSSDSIKTIDKTFVGSLNELKDMIESQAAITKVKVITGYFPSELENNTLYYVKRAGSTACDVYITSRDETGTVVATSLGSTEIDLSGYIPKTDIVTNLTTDNDSKVLSAKQGKLLSDTKVDIYAGDMYAGQILKVGNDGNITYADMPQSAFWGNIDGTITAQDDLIQELNKRMPTTYSSAQDGYVAKVDPSDHTLKVMEFTIPSPTFTSLDGSPNDNTNLKNALAGKLNVQYTAEYDGYVVKVDPSDHKLKPLAAGTTTVKFVDVTGSPSDNLKLKTALEEKVNVTDIVDNHTTVASTKPLSASQGKVLYDAIHEHTSDTTNPHHTSVASLGDVDTAYLGDGRILRYNASTSKWELSDYICDEETAYTDTVWSSAYIKSKLDTLASKVPIVVAQTQPSEPRQDTLYFIGTASPYAVKLYGLDQVTEEYKWFDMGTTEIDLSAYVKKTDIVNNLTTENNDKALSAKQGKILNETKATIYFGSSEPEGIQPGEFWASPDNEDSGIYGTEIKVSPTDDDTLDVALNKKVNASGFDQAVYNIVYPVGKVVLQYADTDNPNTLKPSTVTATWTDVTDTFDLRYFEANTIANAGTKLGEQLPNIKGTINSAWLPNYGGSGALAATSTSGGNYGTVQGDIGYGVSLNAHNSSAVYTDGGAVRPLTSTVKVWRRTA